LLGERRVPVAELSAFATDRSLGRDIELGDEVVAVEDEMPRLAGHDLIVLCTPREVALELGREALRASVPCIDCSGAFADQQEIPLGLCELGASPEVLASPIVAVPPGPVLGWLYVLHALHEVAALERVSATVLRSAAQAGGGGVDALSAQTIATLTHQDLPTDGSELFGDSMAFDCIPLLPGGDVAAEEARWSAIVARRFPSAASRIAISALQVPSFAGDGTVLAVELDREVDPGVVREALSEAPGVAVWEDEATGPTTRQATGCEHVWVSRVRRDPGAPARRGLLMWLACDPLRLAASDAVGLAEARLRLN